MAGKNLASKYSKKVDERFTLQSQVAMALNNDYEFTGVETVKVYSIPVVAMNDYQRAGDHRYGVPDDLSRNVQTMTVTRDRAFTFIIDKGDKLQSEMVMDAGKAMSRQTNEVIIPEYDAYCFGKLAAAATANGGFSAEPITKENAYEAFLAGNEFLGNHNVPEKGRVAFCTYRYANYLKQDPAFMKYGNLSQEMVLKGVIGEVDGTKIVKVPSSRLPAGAAFLIAHPLAATAPKQLQEFKIHDNPPGISGWLCEGRIIYDLFVLNEKADALYYHGTQSVLKTLTATASPEANGSKTTVVITTLPSTPTNTFAYKAYKSATGAPAVTFGGQEAASWTAVKSGDKIAPGVGNDMLAIAELDSSKNAVGICYIRVN